MYAHGRQFSHASVRSADPRCVPLKSCTWGAEPTAPRRSRQLRTRVGVGFCPDRPVLNPLRASLLISDPYKSVGRMRAHGLAHSLVRMRSATIIALAVLWRFSPAVAQGFANGTVLQDMATVRTRRLSAIIGSANTSSVATW
jgi:hypothetical protein